MSDFYARMAETSLRLIADKGRTVTLSTPNNGEYVAGVGMTAGAPDENPVSAVFVSYKTKDIDGTKIIAGDKQCLIAAASLQNEPTTADSILEDEFNWAVINVEVVKPAGTALLYKLQVRK